MATKRITDLETATSVASTDVFHIVQSGVDKQASAELINSKILEEFPDSLPNPYSLTINGTVYDGSEAKSITIEGGGGTTSNRVRKITASMTGDDIVTAANELAALGGGDIFIDPGEYTVSSPICITGAVNIHGSGVKNTVIKASTSMTSVTGRKPDMTTEIQVYPVIFIANTACCFELENFTIDGQKWGQNSSSSQVQNLRTSGGAEFGIYAVPCKLSEVTDYDYFHVNDSDYVKTSTIADKVARIHNLFIYGCDIGAYFGAMTFMVHFSESTLMCNCIGMLDYSTDSMHHDLDIERNAGYGVIFYGANDKISNLKVWKNGYLASNTSFNSSLAIVTESKVGISVVTNGYVATYACWFRGNLFNVSNIETQENFANAYGIDGDSSFYMGLTADSDGKNYSIQAPAYNVKGKYNTIFCTVNNRVDGGAAYTYPILFSSASAYNKYSYMIYPFNGNSSTCTHAPCTNTSVSDSGTGNTQL